MVKRSFWIGLLERQWRRRSVLWLCGARRAGKTVLCQSLENVEYFDCELPRVRRMMEDPEEFLSGLKGKRIVLDEIHRLPRPSELLKIAADHFPSVRVVATGSSILEASARFKDTLTGRKTEIWLTPMNSRDLMDFGGPELSRRLLRGGIPPFFLSKNHPEADFQEWMDSYWARDVQALFRLERRDSFIKFMELLFAQSGAIFEATRFAAPCEISRQTVTNYLAVLEATKTVSIIRPYSSRKPSEIFSAPKTYAFDTGFACHARGLNALRPDDFGILWEHYVLNEIQGLAQNRPVHYWRDKRGHEIDFVLVRGGHPAAAIECKWKSGAFDPQNLAAMRKSHPGGKNWVVSSDVEKPFKRHFGDLEVEFIGLGQISRAAP